MYWWGLLIKNNNSSGTIQAGGIRMPQPHLQAFLSYEDAFKISTLSQKKITLVPHVKYFVVLQFIVVNAWGHYRNMELAPEIIAYLVLVNNSENKQIL